jgi:fructokinase
MTTFGLVELGGTKTFVATGRSLADLSPTRIATTGPEETLGAVADHLAAHDVEAIGVASFGPLDLDETSPTFGRILNTPKRLWAGFDLAGTLTSLLDKPVRLDTDVNAAAKAETRWGALRGTRQSAYLTVGTGIGGGLVVDGESLRGDPHPEIGHVMVEPRHDDVFEGSCVFHGGCLEGMASGPAMAARFGSPLERLGPAATATALSLAAYYVGQGLRDVVYAWAPQRIVIGGGLSKLTGFHDAVAAEMQTRLSGYPHQDRRYADGFVVPPGLGELSGIAGALVLAEGG